MSNLPQAAHSDPTAETDIPSASATLKQVTPLRCLIGAALSGSFAFGMYLMTHAIALSFATHKIQSSNLAVQRISAAVRTLVVGLTTLGMGVFGLATLGLLALAVQLTIRQFRQKAESGTGN
ncbi:MAG: DUF3082 domain-containing protein [Leptodesmis sp.]|uniref:DUF3082 domain-containing protein n=1 Tax=Leptodesmis sp. TaxID=3100501 RepID=UPI003D0ACA89